MTLDDGFTAMEDVRKDISDLGTSQRLRIANYIEDKLYDVWWQADPTLWFSTETISVVSGTSSYARASDYMTDNVNNGGIYETDEDGNAANRPLRRTRYGSTDVGEYRDSTNIIFTPDPTQSDTYKHRYIPIRTQNSATTEDSIIPDRFKELWRDAALVAYDVWDEDYNAEPIDDVRFARILKIFEKLIPQSQGEGVVISDYLVSF